MAAGLAKTDGGGPYDLGKAVIKVGFAEFSGRDIVNTVGKVLPEVVAATELTGERQAPRAPMAA